jgi:hypothetical protein
MLEILASCKHDGEREKIVKKEILLAKGNK